MDIQFYIDKENMNNSEYYRWYLSTNDGCCCDGGFININHSSSTDKDDCHCLPCDECEECEECNVEFQWIETNNTVCIGTSKYKVKQLQYSKTPNVWITTEGWTYGALVEEKCTECGYKEDVVCPPCEECEECPQCEDTTPLHNEILRLSRELEECNSKTCPPCEDCEDTEPLKQQINTLQGEVSRLTDELEECNGRECPPCEDTTPLREEIARLTSINTSLTEQLEECNNRECPPCEECGECSGFTQYIINSENLSYTTTTRTEQTTLGTTYYVYNYMSPQKIDRLYIPKKGNTYLGCKVIFLLRQWGENDDSNAYTVTLNLNTSESPNYEVKHYVNALKYNEFVFDYNDDYRYVDLTQIIDTCWYVRTWTTIYDEGNDYTPTFKIRTCCKGEDEKSELIKGFIEGTLTELVIPEGIEKIGNYAFYQSNLTKVTFPTTLNELGTYAFRSTDVTEFDLSKTQVNKMGSNSIATDKAKVIRIPSTMSKFFDEAFACCKNVTDLYLYSTVPPTVTNNTFKSSSTSNSLGYNNKNSGTNKLHVPQGSFDAYDAVKSQSGWNNLYSTLYCGFTLVDDLEIE